MEEITWERGEIAHKLGMIAALPPKELLGWWRYIHGWRKPFPGEIMALMKRAQFLKLPLPDAGSASTTVTASGQANTSASIQS